MNPNSTPQTEAFLAAKRARDIGLTQASIARAIGASQPQVSRILSGASRRRSRLFKDVCEYVFSFQAKAPESILAESKELTEALAVVWDGTPQHARALAAVIRSLGGLHPGARAADSSPARR